MGHSESESLTEGWRGKNSIYVYLRQSCAWVRRDNLCRQICCSLSMLHLSYSVCCSQGSEFAALPSVRERHEWKHIRWKSPFGWTAKLQRPVILLDFHWPLPSYILLFLFTINYSRTQLCGRCTPSQIRLSVWNVGHPAVNGEESIPHVKWGNLKYLCCVYMWLKWPNRTT